MTPKLNNQRRLSLKAAGAFMVAPQLVFADTPMNADVVIIYDVATVIG